MENLAEWDVLVGRVKDRWDKSLLRITPFSEVKNRFGAGAKLCALKTNGERVLLSVQSSHHKAGYHVCDCGLPSSEIADSLIGAEVFVHETMRPALPKGEFYPDQLIGFGLRGEDGTDLGEIEEVLETNAHEIYASQKALVPAVPEFIARIDGETKTVWVKNAAQFLEE